MYGHMIKTFVLHLGNPLLRAFKLPKMLFLIIILFMDMVLGFLHVELLHCHMVMDLVKM